MIKKDELYEVMVVGTNINHYKQFYPDIKIGMRIKVSGDELPQSSHFKVKFRCDFCGREYERVMYSGARSGLTCQERYGVDHPMQDYEIHKKIR